MADNRPLAIFDSGLGGLTVFSEIKKLLPNESIIYFADQKNSPYSKKTPFQIKEYSKNIVTFLQNKNVKMIVIACNTATCYSLTGLRRNFSVPFVGTVPAIKPAAKKTITKKIAILATKPTAESKYLKNLIEKFAKSVQVTVLADKKMVEEIEEGKIKMAQETFNSYISEIKKQGIDTLVLGCTHFPLLKKGSKPNINFIDSQKAVARQVKRVLQGEGLSAGGKKAKYVFYTTHDPQSFSKIASTLLKYKVGVVKKAVT